MGSGHSARKLTISNEEEVGVIKVSNAIVQRLAQRERSTIDESTADARPGTPDKEPPVPPSATSVAPQTGEAISKPVYYYPELTMSALKMQQQKEQELKQQDLYWQRRLRNIEDGYKKINHILEDEYKQAVSEASSAAAEQKIGNIQSTAQPCKENSNKVLKCFQDHPKETLKCSSLVEEFSNCVWNVHYSRVIETRS